MILNGEQHTEKKKTQQRGRTEFIKIHMQDKITRL